MGVFAKFRLFNRQLALACILIAVSTFNYGFDNQGYATTQAMAAFDRQFGVFDEETQEWRLEPYWLSLFNSLNYIGFAFGVVAGTWIASRWGRRWCMFGMSCYAIVTATIGVTSMTREQIMAARILNYVYVGIELAVVPTFQSEIVPAAARGFMVGSYQLSLILGGLVINSVCFGTSTIQDNRAWRIPLGLFYIVPTIVLSLVLLIPESPRWLLRKGRADEALVCLRKYREGVHSEEEILSEFAELQASLDNEVEQGRFVELFQGNNLKRTAIVAMCNFFMQACGQAFASQYSAIYVRSLNTINPFGYQLINAAVNILTLTCSLLWSDLVGRRTLLFLSSGVILTAMMTMGGLGLEEPVSFERRNAIVAMISLFACGFSIGWAPVTYVITTEVSSLRLRDHTSRVGFTVNVVINFAVNFSIPYLIYNDYAGLNSRVGFIFGSIMGAAIIFVFFCVPECKGKTLEQVDYLFNQGIPLRDFGKTDAAALMGANAVRAEEKLYAENEVATAEKRSNV